jgi:hypothetical protein
MVKQGYDHNNFAGVERADPVEMGFDECPHRMLQSPGLGAHVPEGHQGRGAERDCGEDGLSLGHEGSSFWRGPDFAAAGVDDGDMGVSLGSIIVKEDDDCNLETAGNAVGSRDRQRPSTSAPGHG